MLRSKTSSWRVVCRALLAAAALALLARPVLAQSAQDGFKPLAEVTTESLPASPLLYTAYAFVWVALIAYLFLLWRRVSRVERELSDVRSRLGARR